MGFHGVEVNELPTGVTPPVESLAGFAVYVGTAPFHMSADGTAKLNEPVMVASKAEAVAKLGHLGAEGTAGSKKFAFSLCEAVSAHFEIGNVGPIVLINVLDPDEHITEVTAESRTLGSDGTVKLSHAHALPASVVITVSSSTKTLGTDYTLTVNSAGECVVARVSTGTIDAGATMSVAYDYLTPSKVVAADIVGSVDAATQAKTGLELISEVYPRFQKFPGQVLAPGFSSDSTVKAAMVAKAGAINGNVRAMVLADIPTSSVDVYTEAASWKSTNGFVEKDLVLCWPMGRRGGVLYNMSTLIAARCMQTDADNGGIPFHSPSNKTLPIDSIALANGTAVVFDEVAANTLNDAGIVTAINSNGWRAWGNRTAAYPGSTDAGETFIPIRRMRAWNRTILILSHKQRVDNPMNRRQIETVVESENIRLNGLAAKGASLGGRVEFREELNPVTSLLDGQATYSFLWLPPPPMQRITFNEELDTTYFAALFG